MGRLERKLDLDLIARMEAGGRPKQQTKTRKNKPRKAETYRAARRNAMRGSVWKGIDPTHIQTHVITLNRSRKLPTAKSYADAAVISGRRKQAA